MTITILAVGKLKEAYLTNGIKEYQKRLSRYCTLNLIEVPDEKAPPTLSRKEEEQVMAKEADKLRQHLDPSSHLVVLDRQGKHLSSEQLAQTIQDITTYQASHITFVIGGSLGVCSSLIQQANLVLSFSHLTFPHQLMRLILIEQLYRSFRINNNEPYHK
jgi:23S rRNA (pseudouridine1915-N3)-methyltransferase